jgi:hypothetical protein
LENLRNGSSSKDKGIKEEGRRDEAVGVQYSTGKKSDFCIGMVCEAGAKVGRKEGRKEGHK